AVLAAKEHGAASLVDPRPFAVRSIAQTFEDYPNVGTLLPAMGYGHEQMEDLRETIARSDAELVLIGTPIDLRRLIELDKPALPLYLAGAQTQAEIGALIESELAAVAERPVVCVLTHVRVDEDDPAFERPTKPVGPFYSEEQARTLESERSWAVVHDAGRGWRRVLPSPKPLEIVELAAIQTLVGAGTIAVACGGRGIPVSPRNG